MYSSELGHMIVDETDADFGVCYTQTEPGQYKFSLRSNNNKVDVSMIAAQFGGGGHRNAAGFEIDKPPFKEIK